MENNKYQVITFLRFKVEGKVFPTTKAYWDLTLGFSSPVSFHPFLDYFWRSLDSCKMTNQAMISQRKRSSTRNNSWKIDFRDFSYLLNKLRDGRLVMISPKRGNEDGEIKSSDIIRFCMRRENPFHIRLQMSHQERKHRENLVHNELRGRVCHKKHYLS